MNVDVASLNVDVASLMTVRALPFFLQQNCTLIVLEHLVPFNIIPLCVQETLYPKDEWLHVGHIDQVGFRRALC